MSANDVLSSQAPSFSFYAALVPGQLQILEAMTGWVDKAEAFCKCEQVDQSDLLARKLAPDMLPLSAQFTLAMTHSIDALEGAERGLFKPQGGHSFEKLSGLRSQLRLVVTTLRSEPAFSIDALAVRPVTVVIGPREMRFASAADFLLSFSLPNFFFHATTAYAILRANGVPLGKADYLGPVRRSA